MRTSKEDIELLGEAGVWESEGDPLMNAVILLCMYARGRHKPVRNLHKLAKAVEKGDQQAAQKHYDRLAQEVSTTLQKYPDIAGTLETMSQMSDEVMEEVDRAMETAEGEADEPHPPSDHGLGRELFEDDREAYIRLASSIASDSTRPPLPEELQRISTRSLFPVLPYFDPKMSGTQMTPLAGAVGRFYGEIVSGAYVLATAEEWREFSAREFTRLVNEAIGDGGRSAMTEEKAARVVSGVSGELDNWVPLAAYVEEQPANVRLGAFADTFVTHPGDELRTFIDQDASVSEKLAIASTLGWRAGIVLALLEKAHLVTATHSEQIDE